MIRHTFPATLAGVALGAVLTTAAYTTGAHTAPELSIVHRTATSTADLPARAWQMRTTCPSEDSTNCAWNAHEQGNRRGHSFYVITRRLRSASGRRIVGRVDCHTFVSADADKRYGECQLRHRIGGGR